MERLRLLLCFLTSSSLAACSGNVQQSGSGDTGTTTTSGTTSSDTSGTGTTSSGTSSTSTGGCDGSIDLTVDDGTSQHLGSICVMPGWNPSMSKVPIGYFIEGGPAPGVHNLRIEGCQSAAPGALGVGLSVSDVNDPGNFTMGAADYTEPGTGDWTTTGGMMVKLSVTKLGMIGDTIEGTFEVATVSQPNKAQSHLLSGSFHVCHTQDEAVP